MYNKYDILCQRPPPSPVDHSMRVNIGIAEGVGCLFFSTILIVGLCKVGRDSLFF